MTSNIIMIDLTQFKENKEKESIKEITEFLISININTNIKNLAQDLYRAKKGIMVFNKPFTWQKKWSKVWFFKDTLKIFAYENPTGKHFTNEFVNFMESMPSVQPGDMTFSKNDEYIPYDDEFDEVEDKVCENIDDVLDKINQYGIDSLTDEERDILNHQ